MLPVKAGVPQSSYLRLVLYLFHTSAIPQAERIYIATYAIRMDKNLYTDLKTGLKTLESR